MGRLACPGNEQANLDYSMQFAAACTPCKPRIQHDVSLSSKPARLAKSGGGVQEGPKPI